jgi:hypothetical protein
MLTHETQRFLVLVRVRGISSGCRLTDDALTLYLVAPYDLMTASSDF